MVGRLRIAVSRGCYRHTTRAQLPEVSASEMVLKSVREASRLNESRARQGVALFAQAVEDQS